MTVVPATDTFQTKYTLSCGKENDLHAHYHTAVHKTGSIDVDDGTEESTNNLRYTPYNVKKFYVPPKDTFTAETADLPFGGTLVCNITAAMPLTFEKQEEVRICSALCHRFPLLTFG